MARNGNDNKGHKSNIGPIIGASATVVAAIITGIFMICSPEKETNQPSNTESIPYASDEIALVKYNAEQIVKELRARNCVEKNGREYLKQFQVLNQKYLEQLQQGNRSTAHLILGDIYELLDELKDINCLPPEQKAAK